MAEAGWTGLSAALDHVLSGERDAVESDHGLHITDLPFQPGSTVEVIVLEPLAKAPGKPRLDRERAARILSLAGSWADMPEDDYNSLCEELEQRRDSGAGRRRREAGLD